MSVADGRQELRRNAAQQASIGNYWAGKCVALIDELERRSDAWEQELPPECPLCKTPTPKRTSPWDLCVECNEQAEVLP